MSKETGGPAFPFTPTQDRHAMTPGMTLRDYFAAKAMASTIADPACARWTADEHARNAYRVAGAMIAARGQ